MPESSENNTGMAIADQPRIFGLALAQGMRRLRRMAGFGLPGSLRLGGSVPERLVIAPPDLHTADPTVAQDIYAGNFSFDSHLVTAAGVSPFAIEPPSEQWERELHGFSWLRHLSAAGDALSASNAQALVRDWIATCGRPGGDLPWQPEIAARRLLAWLCHSVLIVEGVEYGFYRQFMRSIGVHVRYLRRNAGTAADGMPRLTAQIALAYAAACVAMPGSGPIPEWGDLDEELARQILPDGGHVSRNPGVLPEILALLLPLRQSFARLGVAPSPELLSAIDRMLPAVRFHRLGDGSLARFNGVSATPHDLIATVLRYDDTHGATPAEASHSGYQRIEHGQTILLVDAGPPPAAGVSSDAHAGCLSFEMSDGRCPVIVNCGAPAVPGAEATLAARSTAAHSTATVNDTSSCRFATGGMMGRYLGGQVVAGPQEVNVGRRDDGETTTITANHDGYLRAFGIIHERTLRLSGGGAVLSGLDSFHGENGGPPRHSTRDRIALRFHIHPAVRVRPWTAENAVLLWTTEGRRWRFTCDDVPPEVEESIFFAAAGGRRRTSQIVLNARAAQHPRISWTLEIA